MNEIIFVVDAASVMGHGAYWRGAIATLKSCDCDTPLGGSPHATIPGMNEILALGGRIEGLAPFPILPVVVPRGFFHFVSLGQLFHVQAG
jgi:hypothetical protein